jgi:hypothetical protein
MLFSSESLHKSLIRLGEIALIRAKPFFDPRISPVNVAACRRIAGAGLNRATRLTGRIVERRFSQA